MHIIPQSWSHLHILIGVFPSIGLVIGLCIYAVALRTGDEFTKRICLALFCLLGLLSIPIYISGAGSMAALSENPRFTKEAMNTHYLWASIALGVLVLFGILAALTLWRSAATKRISDPFHLVVGFALITLVLTAIADDLGWRINHRELESVISIADVSTSQGWSHVHIILNHVPTAGIVFAIAFFISALVAGNELLKRASLALFVICAIAGVPTYVVGTAAMWALTQPPIPDIEISKAAINAHRDMALWTLVGLAFTGGAAWLELWRARYRGHFSKLSLNLILLFAFITLGIMTETGHRGGLINHAEIRTAADVLPTDVNAGISNALETTMQEMIWFVPWQTVHFFGYCLILGAAFAVVLRVLGVWKSVSFAAMHQLLLLGFLGVLMNVVSGMLMMLSDSYRYVVNDSAFAPKMILLVLGAVAILYLSLSKRLWNVKAGENAPVTAKWIATVALLAWAGVIVCGRLLPYL